MDPKFNQAAAVPFHPSLRLTSWQDWHVWYSTFKNRAQLLQVWDLIDPDQPDHDGDTVNFPAVPLIRDYKEDNQTGPLTAKQEQRYKEDSTDYFILEKVALRKQGALIAIQSVFESAVAKRLLQMTLEHQTLRQKLRALSIAIKPSDRTVSNQLSIELERLKATPYGQEASKYFDKWVDFFYKIKIQLPKSFGFSYSFEETELCQCLGRALQPFEPNMAAIRLDSLSMDPDVPLEKEINFWRAIFMRKKVEKFPTSNGASKRNNGVSR